MKIVLMEERKYFMTPMRIKVTKHSRG